jgi:hypothetical protein
MRPWLPAALLLVASCGAGDRVTTEEPPVRDVRVAYESRLPEGCPDAGSVCAAMCAHHNAPAGLQVVVPLWDAPVLRLAEVETRRYEGVLPNVPVDRPLRLVVRDIGVCCVDACNYPPVLEDVSLNGVLLTHVVLEGLPEGLSAALEFTVDPEGRVRG